MSDIDLQDLAKRVLGIHDKIASDVPAIARGVVWCRKCSAMKRVDGAECLRSGWPKCCGQTMTIDAPGPS